MLAIRTLSRWAQRARKAVGSFDPTEKLSGLSMMSSTVREIRSLIRAAARRASQASRARELAHAEEDKLDVAPAVASWHRNDRRRQRLR